MCEEEKKPENAGENESGQKDKELMLLVAPVEKCAPCKWWIVLAFMVLLCFATVYIQAHYLIDVFAGWISAIGIYVLSTWMYKRWFASHDFRLFLDR